MLIIGAGGFAKELLEAVMQTGIQENICFYDDVTPNVPNMLFNRFPILRTLTDAERHFEKDVRFSLGVGSPNSRKLMFDKFTRIGGKMTSIVSPTAQIGRFANTIGDGCTILGDVVIESSNVIGNGCLIHVGALVSHDCTVGDFCEISPRVNLLGAVEVGDYCSLGTNSTILPKVKLGSNVIVGAGAVVTKDVPDNVTVVGIPARVG